MEKPTVKFEFKIFLSGFISTFTTASIFQPFDVMRTTMILHPLNFRQAIRFVAEKEGYKGFWRGAKAAGPRSGLGGGIFWVTLENLKQRNQNSFLYEFGSDAILAGSARGFSAVIVSPLTMVKSRMETPGFNKYKSVQDGIRQILKLEGIMGFYQGLVPYLCRDVPQAAL